MQREQVCAKREWDRVGAEGGKMVMILLLRQLTPVEHLCMFTSIHFVALKQPCVVGTARDRLNNGPFLT